MRRELTQEEFDKCAGVSLEIIDRLDHERKKIIMVSTAQCVIDSVQFIQIHFEHHNQFQGEKKWDLFTIPAIDIHNGNWIKYLSGTIDLPPLPDGYDPVNCQCARCKEHKAAWAEFFEKQYGADWQDRVKA